MVGKTRGRLLAFGWLLISFSVSAQHLVINELMSDNDTTLVDGHGDSHDWIELYNASGKTIELSSYYLSDNRKELKKWQLPSMKLAPYEYLLVFASGSDNGPINHTNFKISSGGEPLYLSNYKLEIIDHVIPKALAEDESYGRVEDGTGTWWTQDLATPGVSNKTGNHIIFSHYPGFYKDTFLLSTTSLKPYEIRYTLNGSLPSVNSPILSDSLPITHRSKEPNKWSNIKTSGRVFWQAPFAVVPKATVLRCAGFIGGQQATSVYTHTYFVGRESYGFELPIISLVADSHSLFDHDTGIYVPGVHQDSLNPEWTGNYYQKGEEWERLSHLSYFEKNGQLGFAQNAGIRTHGLRTRSFAQKTLKVYAREEYGKRYFNYPLFPQKKRSQYKRFLLRATMGSWSGQTVIQDELAHDIIRGLDLEYQDFRPVIVFLNGEFWGIQTIRDRIDERYLAYTTGVHKDSVDIIAGNHRLVSAGSNAHYVALLEYLKGHDLSIPAHYEYVKTQIDIDNYIDYQIAEQFFANIDWPSNNMKMWRPQTPDGKWRWIFYDLDAGFTNDGINMLEHVTLNDSTVSHPNSPESTFLFRMLLQSDAFKTQFIDRYGQLLHSTLASLHTAGKYEDVKLLYQADMASHCDRWNYPKSYEVWEEHLSESIVSFLADRPCKVSRNIISFFDLDYFDFDCVRSGLKSKGVNISPNPCDQYFAIGNPSQESFYGLLQVFDMHGRRVLLNDALLILSQQRHTVEVSHLPPGTYLLTLQSDTELITEKISIVR